MIICNHGMIKMTFFGIVYVIATTLLVFVLPVVWVSFFHFRILCLVSSFYVVVSIIYKLLCFKFKMKSPRKKLSQKLSSNEIKKRMKRETVYERKILFIFSKLLRKKKGLFYYKLSNLSCFFNDSMSLLIIMILYV
jgi:hypothetical protein